MELLKVLIIGAGNIGALFDRPDSKFVLTHAHAFKKHKGFDLLGFIDSDEQKAINASAIWDCQNFCSLTDAFSRTKVDVVCIANPDEFHYSTLKEVAKYSIKSVFSEKPFTKTEVEGQEIINLYKKLNIPISVNYSRRFVPEFQELRRKISDGMLGSFLCGTGFYGKGILHNGSHMIDMLRFLIGEVEAYKVLNSCYDFYKDDPSVSCLLYFKNQSSFNLQYVNCSKYTIFEADLLFEKGRVSITESGLKISYSSVQQSTVYKGYNFLQKDLEVTTELFNAMYVAADNIYQNLNSGIDLLSPAWDAYLNLAICNRILNSAKNLRKTKIKL